MELTLGWLSHGKNRTVPANGSINLSALIGIGEPTIPSKFNITNSEISAVESDGDISITGRIDSEESTKIVTIYLTVDGDTSNNLVIAQNIPLGVTFNYNLKVSELNLPDGVHTLEIWAGDPQGALSNAGILIVRIFTPQNFVLDPLGINEIPENQTSISFNGTGEIGRHVNGSLVDLILSDIRLIPNSHIIAHHLVISRSLRLLGNSILSAAANTYIKLEENVQIVFDLVNGSLPTLNLGNIPENVTIPTPFVFQVTIPADFFEDTLIFALVSGRNFDCEGWRRKVNVPMRDEKYQFEMCQSTWNETFG